ncbi:DUF4352 domain-containing protein [Streptomyces sp. JW3]|uniref:DUF4352 domain-containing protein n=1 Tax=Streptomyces sp. JW3 TaxID=3456955 RepID=UPI003FA42E28
MNQQYPQQPGQPQQPAQPYPQQQPGWGGPHPGGHAAPGYVPPGPQPPKKNSTGKIVGFGCLSVVALFVLVAIIGTIGSGNDTSGNTDNKAASAEQPSEAEDKPASEDSKAGDQEQEPAAENPSVKITAKPTAFSPSVIAQGTDYTSVLVEITNNSDDTIDVNPLYFAITDSDGTKHASELAVDTHQIDTVKIAPGENVSGAITGEGKFTAKTVTYTDGLLGDPVRIDIS